MRKSSGLLADATTYPFKPVRMGAGGYIETLAMSNDGVTKACGADVYGLYVLRTGDAEWRSLITPATLQTSEYDPKPVNLSADFPGCIGIAVAPSDNTRIFGAWNGFWYKFNYSAGAWAGTRCNLAAKRHWSNGGDGTAALQRLWNDKVAIHPTNKDIAIFGSFNDGVNYTTDGGATMPAVTIGANSANKYPYLVGFDPTNGNNVYAFRQGTGLTGSTTGVTGSFNAISGGPTFCSHLLIDANGVVWVCDPNGTSGSNVWKYASSTWTQITGIGLLATAIAVDPANTNRVSALDYTGASSMTTSTTGASTWLHGVGSVWNLNNRYIFSAAGDIEWTTGLNIFSAKILYNPAVANELWCANGLGVAKSTPPSTYANWSWQSVSKGIEELVANNGLSVPGLSTPIFGCWDKPIWVHRNVDAFIESPKSCVSQGIDHAWQFGYPADDPTYIGVAAGFTNDTSGFSQNSGGTFAEFFPNGFPTGQVGGNGGAYAINRKAQQILVPGNNMRAIGTHNGWGISGSSGNLSPVQGTDWDFLPIDPNVSGFGNWINANYVRRNIFTADQTRAGVFAGIMNGTNQGTGAGGTTGAAAKQGLYVTTTGPLGTWNHVITGRLDSQGDPSDFWSATLAYIPGKSGELLYNTAAASSWPNARLLYYTNDGASGPTYLGGFTGVKWFGFGKKLDGQSYPAIFIVGTLGGVTGLYVTFDFFNTTAILVARFPGNLLDNISAIFGDMNIVGRCYVGHSGSAWVYCDAFDPMTFT